MTKNSSNSTSISSESSEVYTLDDFFNDVKQLKFPQNTLNKVLILFNDYLIETQIDNKKKNNNRILVVEYLSMFYDEIITEIQSSLGIFGSFALYGYWIQLKTSFSNCSLTWAEFLEDFLIKFKKIKDLAKQLLNPNVLNKLMKILAVIISEILTALKYDASKLALSTEMEKEFEQRLGTSASKRRVDMIRYNLSNFRDWFIEDIFEDILENYQKYLQAICRILEKSLPVFKNQNVFPEFVETELKLVKLELKNPSFLKELLRKAHNSRLNKKRKTSRYGSRGKRKVAKSSLQE